MTDEELYARLEPPKTIVVRFGAMKLVGEYPYDGDAKPGCGSKLVARTHRGTEVVEMLTTTCSNAGCAKSITRQEMLDYIDNSGGKDFPFYTNGRILRVATIDDLNQQSELNTRKNDYIRTCKGLIRELGLNMKLVDVEPILGGELLTFYYMAEERVDFRELVKRLASDFKTRIEMRQVGARDEARLVADYERCGQHCCCKNFLKVLKPVSMQSAKVQKATLDPLKISGRCGRLMCCLRYEDQTYRELRKKLPKRNTRVGTSEGPGVVIDGKILVQLVLVRLDHDRREVAVPVEELMDPNNCPDPTADRERLEDQPKSRRGQPQPDPLRGLSPEEVADRTDDTKRKKRRKRRRGSKTDQQDAYREKAAEEDSSGADPDTGGRKKKRRRRRQSGNKPDGGTPEAGNERGGEKSEGSPQGQRKRRRGGRRRGKGRKRPGGGDAGNDRGPTGDPG